MRQFELLSQIVRVSVVGRNERNVALLCVAEDSERNWAWRLVVNDVRLKFVEHFFDSAITIEADIEAILIIDFWQFDAEKIFRFWHLVDLIWIDVNFEGF